MFFAPSIMGPLRETMPFTVTGSGVSDERDLRWAIISREDQLVTITRQLKKKTRMFQSL